METIEGPPRTETELRDDLARLGVKPGMTLMVHSSLSAIGWVIGGAPAVVRALLAAVGPEGTLAMPAATPHCADPADWPEPKVPDAWLPAIREHLPVFDPRTTPTTIGAIAETFRNWPGTLRSAHPLESVCARGRHAEAITRNHPLAFSEGPDGPFGKLHELDSWILLLGVGFNRCTALHYAETVSPKRRLGKVRFPALERAGRVWREEPNVAGDHGAHFPAIGDQFLAAGRAKQGPIGAAPSILCGIPGLAAFAVDYFERTL